MAATQKTRLAIIGCGAVVQHHILPALRRIGWRPQVLADPSLRNLEASKRIVGGSKHLLAVADWATAADAFDAAIVAAPHTLHGPLGLALAKAGKHIFMEKPLAIRASDCETMLTAAAEYGVILSVYNRPRRRAMHQARSH